VAAFMLPEGYIAINQRLLGREQHGSHAFFAQQFVHGSRHGTAEEHSFCIDPLAFYRRGAGADKYRSRRTHRHQMMAVNGKVFLR
jgi:hypothetical protein